MSLAGTGKTFSVFDRVPGFLLMNYKKTNEEQQVVYLHNSDPVL